MSTLDQLRTGLGLSTASEPSSLDRLRTGMGITPKIQQLQQEAKSANAKATLASGPGLIPATAANVVSTKGPIVRGIQSIIKAVGQGIMRSGASVGQTLLNPRGTTNELKVDPTASTFEQSLHRLLLGDEPVKDLATRIAEAEVKHPSLSKTLPGTKNVPVLGQITPAFLGIGALTAMDFTGAGGEKNVYKILAASDDVSFIAKTLRQIGVADDLIEPVATTLKNVTKEADVAKALSKIDELQRTTKVIAGAKKAETLTSLREGLGLPHAPAIAPELEALAAEARKYKSAEEFHNALFKDTADYKRNPLLEKYKTELDSMKEQSKDMVAKLKEQNPIISTDALSKKIVSDFYNQATKGIAKAKDYSKAIGAEVDAVRSIKSPLGAEILDTAFKKASNAYNGEFYKVAGLASHPQAIVKIDNFKALNESLGHIKGDEIIARMEKALENVLPDRVVHIGGKDFSIITDGLSKDELTTALAKARKEFPEGFTSTWGKNAKEADKAFARQADPITGRLSSVPQNKDFISGGYQSKISGIISKPTLRKALPESVGFYTEHLGELPLAKKILNDPSLTLAQKESALNLLYQDSQTGLLNLKAYGEGGVIAKRQTVIDLDDLGKFRDARGDKATDTVVETAAKMLQEAFGKGKVYRKGSGEELVIDGLSDKEVANVLEQVRIKFKAKTGVNFTSGTGDSFLLADEALKEGKTSGKGVDVIRPKGYNQIHERLHTKNNGDANLGRGVSEHDLAGTGRPTGEIQKGGSLQGTPGIGSGTSREGQGGLTDAERIARENSASAKTPPQTRTLPSQAGIQSPSLRERTPLATPPTGSNLKLSSLVEDTNKLANSQVNVSTLNISPEGRKLVETTVEEVKPDIQEAVGRVLSNKEALDYAERTSKILERSTDRAATLEWEASLLRARQKLSGLAESGSVDKEFIDTLLAIKTQGTDIARKLQSYSIGADPKDITSKQAIIEAVLKVTENTDDILAKAKDVDFTNLKQATDFYREFIKPTTGEWVDLLRYNSMLSSPNTHINNFFSNMLNSSMVAPIEKALTGGLDFIKTALTGRERAAFAGEGAAYIANYFKGVGEATRRFGEVLRGNRAYTNLDIKHLPVATKGIKGRLASILSVPMKLLEGSDQFFTALAESAETGALTYRQSKGVKVGNIASKAEENAAYRLYRSDLFDKKQGHVLDAIDHFTSVIMSLRNNKNPLVSNISKFTVPFIKTPMNIFKQGIEYSPAGFGTVIGAKNKTEQLSKAIIGSAVFAGAATLLASNRISWSEPVDPKLKAAFRAAGRQSYSVKVGDTWVSYQKLPPPVAFPLAMVAALNDVQQNKKVDDDFVDMVLTSVAKYGQFLADQSYAKSIGDLLSAAKGGEAAISQVISNYPQQLIPYRALGGWLARLTDHTQRKVDSAASFIDKQVQLVMMNIPGLSRKVPARLDAAGNPIPLPNPLLNAFSPVKTSTESKEKAAGYERVLDLKARNKKEAAESASFADKADAKYAELKKLPKEQAAKEFDAIAKSDPKLAKKIIDVIEDEKLGLSYEDKLIKALGVDSGERADLIATRLKALKTKQEKGALWEELVRKKLITPAVSKQLAKLI